MKPLIRFDSVTVTIAGRRILDTLDLSLYAGEKAVIRGPSGSGKSTLLKTLLGLYTPESGRILFEGDPLDADRLAALRRSVAYVGQEPLLGAATVREALLLPFGFKANRALRPTDAALVAVLAELGLPGTLLAQPCQTVSGGEKQRVAIARAKLLQKNIYLLDEVTAGLDAISKQAVIRFFRDPVVTVLSIAHDPEWIACCEPVWDLCDGQLIRAA